jgi:hypothetical protein
MAGKKLFILKYVIYTGLIGSGKIFSCPEQGILGKLDFQDARQY